MTLLITCEHAGNEVPDKYVHLFEGHTAVLNTHRGWDPGAHEAATKFAAKFQATLFACKTTRLLVEVNRSPDNPQVFSEFSRRLSRAGQEELLTAIYRPYRAAVEHFVATHEDVLHLSMHSFTPVLEGATRTVDVGLLFDEARSGEVAFCACLKDTLVASLPEYRIKDNEPYRGTDDGLTTYLRTVFPDNRYRGIEIEMNQAMYQTPAWEVVTEALIEATKVCL